MNATEDGEPLGESPAIDTLTAIGRGAVLGILSAADEVLAVKQLAERQTKALKEVRSLHRRINLVSCAECGENPDDGCVCVGDEPGMVIRRVCEECGQDEDEEWTDYPCATVRAIDSAGV